MLTAFDARAQQNHFFFVVWASCYNPMLGRTRSGAGVEQPFDCLIIQNRQAVQSVGYSMDWTLEDNSVDSLFFCATLTCRKRGHNPFVQGEAETSKTDARRLCQNHAICGSAIPGGGCQMKVRSLVFSNNSHSVGDRPRAPHFWFHYQMNWWAVVWRAKLGVSIWDVVHFHEMDRWAQSGADVQAPWRGVLETVWLLCDEALQVGCVQG